ncbi:MAG: hypothetical protein Q7S21_02155 [archaeon]|nr:hypothetical protein [archaeon]
MAEQKKKPEKKTEEQIPRRLNRFHRKVEAIVSSAGKIDTEAITKDLFSQFGKKQISKKEIVDRAANEVKKFREEKNRLPTDSEYSAIAEKIFKQIKKDYELQGAKQTPQQKTSGRKTQSKQAVQTAKQIPEKPLNPAEQRRLQRKMEREQVEQKRTQIETGTAVPKMQEQRIERRHGRRAEEKQIEQPLPSTQIEGLSLKELLGEKPKTKSKEKTDEFSLEGLEEFGKQDMQEIQSLEEEHVTKQVNAKNSCPNCSAKTSHIIFCPDCGTAYCSHCAKTAIKEKGIEKYSCPKCGRETKISQ